MKRFFSYFLIVSMLLVLLPVQVNAAEADEEIIYLEDGSYISITVEEHGSRASGTKTGSKTYTYTYDGGTAWKAILSGTFSYTGTSATCTNSGCSVTIYDSAWYTVSKSAGKSGNSATASVTMGRKSLGVTVAKVPISMKLTCDANGNLS